MDIFKLIVCAFSHATRDCKADSVPKGKCTESKQMEDMKTPIFFPVQSQPVTDRPAGLNKGVHELADPRWSAR